MAGKLRAAVFSRESKGKGSSIDDQERENLAAAADFGAEVPTHLRLRDKVGASRFSKKERVGWPEVTELVRTGQIDVLIVWEVARADRVMDTWVPFVTACAENGVRFHITSLEMTYDPRKAAHRKALLDMGSTAEAETGQLSERSRKGIRGAALAGKSHGKAAYGYTREYGPIVENQRTFTEIPNEHAPIVVEIITRVAKQDPLITIMRDLNARGIPSPLGGIWHRTTITRLVRRVVYLGKRRHEGELYDGNWPPISSAPDWEETFWRAQAVLDAPDRRQTRPGQTKYLLAYIVTAGGCAHGGRLSRQSNPGKWKSPRYKCDQDSCVSVGAEELDEYILQLVLARLSQPDARRFFAASSVDLEAAKREVKRLQDQLDEARDSFADPNGGISAAALAAKERRIEPLLEEARGRLRAARQVDAVLTVFGDDHLTEDVARERWNAAGIIARRAVVKQLFESIEVWTVPYVLAVRQLNRSHSFADRMAIVADRVVIKWRIPKSPSGGESAVVAEARVEADDLREVDAHAQPAAGR